METWKKPTCDIVMLDEPWFPECRGLLEEVPNELEGKLILDGIQSRERAVAFTANIMGVWRRRDCTTTLTPLARSDPDSNNLVELFYQGMNLPDPVSTTDLTTGAGNLLLLPEHAARGLKFMREHTTTAGLSSADLVTKLRKECQPIVGWSSWHGSLLASIPMIQLGFTPFAHPLSGTWYLAVRKGAKQGAWDVVDDLLGHDAQVAIGVARMVPVSADVDPPEVKDAAALLEVVGDALQRSVVRPIPRNWGAAENELGRLLRHWMAFELPTQYRGTHVCLGDRAWCEKSANSQSPISGPKRTLP